MRSRSTFALISALAAAACGGADDPYRGPAPETVAGVGGFGTGTGAASGGTGAGAEGGAGGWAPATPLPFEARTLYLALTDRFENGDPLNDDAGDPGCTDAMDPIKFHGGDFDGLRARLAYLEELGVSALWITPVYEQTGPHNDQCGYHGYWARYRESGEIGIEPKLGDAAALDALLADADTRDIAVLADMIVNHSGRGAPIVSERPDWLHDPAVCDTLGNPVVYCPLAGLPDFAQEKPEVAAYLTGMSTAFLARFAFDGVRMDTAKHVPLSYFADDWVPAVRSVRPDLFLLAEVFDESGPGALAPVLDAGFDSATGFPLRRGLVQAFAKGGSLDEVASRAQGSVNELGLARANRTVTFLDNHDVPRFISEMPGGMEEEERVLRYHAALVALFTLPGIPQLYYGDELGMIGVWPENRRDMPSFAWDAATRDGSFEGYLGNPQETFALVASLAALKRATPALQTGSYVELWRPNGGAANVFAFFRSAGESRLIVVFNGGDAPVDNLAIKLQENPGISRPDKAALVDGAALSVLASIGSADAAIQDGKLVVSLEPLSAFSWRVP